MTVPSFHGLPRCLWELAVESAAALDRPVDVITWVPASAPHRRGRGFDQGRLLAHAVAQHLPIRATRTLRRGDDTPQTGRSRDERLGGPALLATSYVGGHVLVVDDVITTGASVSSAALALRRAGAECVSAIAAAYTPPGGAAAT